MTRRRCRTPWKVAHPSKAAAEKHAGGLYAKEGKAALVRPYLCECGSWHVGGRKRAPRRGRRRVKR